jgi:acyl-CoA synthetase (AMP-forming)/AMP-acid ligase II
MTRSPRNELPSSATIIDYLRWRAEHQPQRPSHTFLRDGEVESEHLTFFDLDRRARAIAAQLQELKLTGARVLLLYPPGLEFIAACYGCLFAGAIAVPAYPPDPTRLDQSLPRLLSILGDCEPSAVLSTVRAMAWLKALSLQSRIARPLAQLPLPAALGGDRIRGLAAVDLRRLEALKWVATDRISDALAPQWRPIQASPDSLAYLQYTSGSTAQPRGVMIRHGNLIANLGMGTELTRVTEESSAVGWLPLYHDFGLVCYAMGSAFNGCRSILMSPLDFLHKPVRWLRAIARYRTTHNAGPNFGYDLCVRRTSSAERASLDLSSWIVAGNGAEPVRQSTLESFAAAFRQSGFRAESFFPSYGLAEATLFISSGKQEEAAPRTLLLDASQLEDNSVLLVPETEGSPRAVRLVSNGRTGAGHEVLIVDPETHEPCPPLRIGEIWFLGPSVAAGYWGQEQATQECFAARAAGGTSPFLRTGDLGFLFEGELYVTGRLKDLIILHGSNHYPLDIEETVWSCSPALRAGCGAAFAVDSGGAEQLVIVQELDEREPLDAAELASTIRRAVLDRHQLVPSAIVLIKRRTIPKTSSGKIQRRACRDLYQRGQLQELFRDRASPASPEPPSSAPPQ